MKKIFITLLLVFSLTLIPFSAACADDYFLVIDNANLLTDNERDTLEKKAERITEEYLCEVLIVTLDSIGGQTAMYASEELYAEYGFGYGPDRNCVLLLLSMEYRDYDLGTWGFANTAFTEHGKDVILDKRILPLLKKNNYYEAFSAYLDQTEVYLAMARAGTPFDKDTDPDAVRKNLLIKLGSVILLSLLIALGICLFWKSQMETAKIARTAEIYIPEGGFNLTGQQDQFLYRTSSRTKIVKSSGSSGSSHSSSGGSHRSGKF